MRLRIICCDVGTEPLVCCPACGTACQTVFVLRGTDVALGCENCVAAYDADLWMAV